MKKLMIIILCLLVVGVVTADAQKRKSYKAKSTQKRVVKKKKVPVDTLNIFSYLEEHGRETTGVRLRKIGNDYMLTAVRTDDIRIDMDRAIALSKQRTDEMFASGRFDIDIAEGRAFRAQMIPGIETKVDKTVADKVIAMIEEGKLLEMEKYYTTKEEEQLTGGSWWNVTLQLPGKPAVSSGGRNGLGPQEVFDIYNFLFDQEVTYKYKRKK